MNIKIVTNLYSEVFQNQVRYEDERVFGNLDIFLNRYYTKGIIPLEDCNGPNQP
jgi:hypothetical protein